MNENEMKTQLRLLGIEREILLQTIEDQNNEIEDLQSDVAFWKESSEGFEKKCDPQNINEVFCDLDKEKLWTKRLREKNTELELLVANHEGHIKVLQEEINELKKQLEAFDGVDAELDADTYVMEAIEKASEVSEEEMAAIEEEAKVEVPFLKDMKVAFTIKFYNETARYNFFGVMARDFTPGDSHYYVQIEHGLLMDSIKEKLFDFVTEGSKKSPIWSCVFPARMVSDIEEDEDAER